MHLLLICKRLSACKKLLLRAPELVCKTALLSCVSSGLFSRPYASCCKRGTHDPVAAISLLLVLVLFVLLVVLVSIESARTLQK